ncbi:MULTISPECIES: crotonase/enoyl-CoA hydratase family protein [Citromicrobium]|uniref:crotonase/enoyl-CoA hydratase family protein n=1 Tax=Citromicrobium TaxID=72173 RepID=UPI0001DD0573|nr:MULTISPECIES: crotonase/enoyl-CoA hydratase family protein [Citromicrobium]ALG60484.1 enoyl-CoA hydratase [Citromicrobium sp. JL477]
MAYETIRYELENGVATLTLSRPEKMNAFTTGMLNEMLDALDRVDADDDVCALIVTGDGKAFCAGADISNGAGEFLTDGEDSVRNADGSFNYSSPAARDGGGRLTLRLFELKKPVIAAVNGAAVGVGSTMLLPMDVRIASENARFGFVFARRGIVPEAASSWFLPRVVGISQAARWCYSGRVFDAAEALSGGLVQSVVPQDELIPTARAIAQEFADQTAPVSIALTRQMLWKGLGMSHPMEAHRVDSRAILSRSLSADAQEGVNAFLEKRPADFPMKVSTDMPDFYPWSQAPEYD